MTGSVINSPRPFYTSLNNTDSISVNPVGYAVTSNDMPAENVDIYVHTSGHITTPIGSNVTLRIKYGNRGLPTATSVVITAMTEGTYVSDTSGITPVIDGYTITWQIPDLNYTDVGYFDLTLIYPAPTPMVEYYTQFDIDTDASEINQYDNWTSVEIIFGILNYLPLIKK